MTSLSATEQAVIEAMQERRGRLKTARSFFDAGMASQKCDALYLVDQGNVPMGEIALYAGITRMTLHNWLTARERGRDSTNTEMPGQTSIA